MAIEIVSFPIKNGDFPLFSVCLPEGIPHSLSMPQISRPSVSSVFTASQRLPRNQLGAQLSLGASAKDRGTLDTVRGGTTDGGGEGFRSVTRPGWMKWRS